MSVRPGPEEMFPTLGQAAAAPSLSFWPSPSSSSSSGIPTQTSITRNGMMNAPGWRGNVIKRKGLIELPVDQLCQINPTPGRQVGVNVGSAGPDEDQVSQLGRIMI